MEYAGFVRNSALAFKILHIEVFVFSRLPFCKPNVRIVAAYNGNAVENVTEIRR